MAIARMRMLMAQLLALTFACAAAGAQDVARLNAATWYQKAFDKYQAVRPLPAENEALRQFQVDPSLGPSPAVRQFLHRVDPALNLTRRAAHQSAVDFSFDAADGVDLSYEHLSQLRTLHSLIGFDLQFKIAEGDHYGAADRLGSMYRMSNHAAGDPMLIGSVVGYAMFEIAERNMKYALDHAAIGQQEAVSLMKALETFDRADPFHIRQAIAHERARTTQWMLNRYSGEGGLERLNEDDGELPIHVDLLADTIGIVDQPGLENELRAADRVMARVVAVFAKPRKDVVQAELADIQARAAAGEFGALATQLPWGEIDQLTMLLSARELLSSRLAALKGLADGTRDPMDFANAAVWYMRAIAVLPRMDPQKLEKVREYAVVHDAPASAELESALDSDEAGEIIRLLEQATNIRRCDFAYTTPPWPVTVRRYHSGMSDLARMLLADAARRLHLGDEAHYSVAANRLAMANRMCGHLAQDKSTTSALVAHAMFKHNDSLIEAGRAAKYLHGDGLREIQRAMRFRAVDPFGYEVAMSELRQDVEKRLLRLTPSRGGESRSKAQSFVAQCDVDRLLWLQVAFDQADAPSERGGRAAASHLQHLDEIISSSAFHDSMAQSDVVRRMIARGEFEALAAVDVPAIANLKQKQEEAFEDVRQALARARR